jgi:hypothetical protein
MDRPILKQQEIPLDSPESCNFFRSGPEKPFVATPAAIEMYQKEVIVACLRVLQEQATLHDGIDYLQVFEDPRKDQPLWFLEDGEGGAITAMLPSDY